MNKTHYCSVCGRALLKTDGPIGPACLRKMRPKNKKRNGMNQYAHINIANYDMFGDNNEQTKNGGTSKNSAGQKNKQNK